MKTRTESFVWMLCTGVFGYAMFCLGMKQSYRAGTAEEVAIAILFWLLAGAIWALTVGFAKDVLRRKTAR